MSLKLKEELVKLDDLTLAETAYSESKQIPGFDDTHARQIIFEKLSLHQGDWITYIPFKDDSAWREKLYTIIIDAKTRYRSHTKEEKEHLKAIRHHKKQLKMLRKTVIYART